MIINPYAFGGGGPPPGGSVTFGALAYTNITSTSTTWNVNLPSGISAGDGLSLMLVMSGTAGSLPSPPAGWTQIDTYDDPNTGFTSRIYERTADGSEGSTVSVSIGVSGNRGKAYVIRMSGQDASPFTTFARTSMPSVSSVNPANVTSAAGALGAVFISGYFGTAITSYPLPDNQRQDNTGGFGEANILFCSEAVAASPFDPGTATFSSAELGVAYSISYQPS